jgi:hypothetical protein
MRVIEQRARWIAIMAAVVTVLCTGFAAAAEASPAHDRSITYGDSQLIDDGASVEVAGSFTCVEGDTYTIDVAIRQRQRNQLSHGDGQQTSLLCEASIANFDVAVQLLDGPTFVQRIARLEVIVTDQDSGVVRTTVFHKKLNT